MHHRHGPFLKRRLLGEPRCERGLAGAGRSVDADKASTTQPRRSAEGGLDDDAGGVVAVRRLESRTGVADAVLAEDRLDVLGEVVAAGVAAGTFAGARPFAGRGFGAEVCFEDRGRVAGRGSR